MIKEVTDLKKPERRSTNKKREMIFSEIICTPSYDPEFHSSLQPVPAAEHRRRSACGRIFDPQRRFENFS
jgi:hypothetical protein